MLYAGSASTSEAAAPSGTGPAPFHPWVESEEASAHTGFMRPDVVRYHSITAHPAHRSKSHEELRWEYHQKAQTWDSASNTSMRLQSAAASKPLSAPCSQPAASDSWQPMPSVPTQFANPFFQTSTGGFSTTTPSCFTHSQPLPHVPQPDSSASVPAAFFPNGCQTSARAAHSTLPFQFGSGSGLNLARPASIVSAPNKFVFHGHSSGPSASSLWEGLTQQPLGPDPGSSFLGAPVQVGDKHMTDHVTDQHAYDPAPTT